MYKNVIIDMDGTLIDSAASITTSIKYALSKIGIEVEDENELVFFVGPPILDALRDYGLNGEQIQEFLIHFKQRYGKEGLYESKMFEGTEDLLKKLKNQGRNLYIATSKKELYAKEIAKHLEIAKYFNGVHGASMDEKIVEKADILRIAIKEHDLDINDSVMVGDRVYDIHGAIKVGLDSVFFEAGYSDEQEAQVLKKEATYAVKDTKELSALFERI